MLRNVLRHLSLVLCSALLAAAADSVVAPSVGDTRLPDAAAQGNRQVVGSLLAQKVNPNQAQGDGMTALHWAAYTNDAPLAAILLKAGANVNAQTRLQALTPLFLAAKEGHAAVIDLLLQAGADANSTNATGSTPLMLAAASGDTAAVKLLLDRGANVNAKEKTWGETPLMFAAAFDRVDVVKLLMVHGADASITSLVERLDSNKGYDPDADDKPKGVAEEKPAADANKAEAAKKAVEKRVAAAKMRSAQAMGGMTALHFAARDGQMSSVQALVEARVDVNELSAADQTSPMLEAIYNGHYDVGKYLLDHGADPKLVNVDGLAPLYAVIDMQWANRTCIRLPIPGRRRPATWLCCGRSSIRASIQTCASRRRSGSGVSTTIGSILPARPHSGEPLRPTICRP